MGDRHTQPIHIPLFDTPFSAFRISPLDGMTPLSSLALFQKEAPWEVKQKVQLEFVSSSLFTFVLSLTNSLPMWVLPGAWSLHSGVCDAAQVNMVKMPIMRSEMQAPPVIHGKGSWGSSEERWTEPSKFRGRKRKLLLSGLSCF